MFGLDRNKLIMIAGSVMAVVTLFYILSTALPSWAKSSSSSGFGTLEVEAGLWQTCLTVSSSKTCASIGSCDGASAQCGKLNGARAFMILTLLCSAVSTLVMFASLSALGSSSSVAQNARFLPIMSVPMGIIGVALGISFYSGRDGSLGAAAALGIVAVILNVAGGLVAFMAK